MHRFRQAVESATLYILFWIVVLAAAAAIIWVVAAVALAVPGKMQERDDATARPESHQDQRQWP